MDRTSRKKINKERETLNDTLDQKHLIDIFYSISHESSRIYVLFTCPWITSQDRPHVAPQNKSQKFKKTDIRSSVFSDHTGRKLEINCMKTNKLDNTKMHGGEITATKQRLA